MLGNYIPNEANLTMLTSRSFVVQRTKMLSLLNSLDTFDDKAISIYMPPGLSVQDIEVLLQKVVYLQTPPENMAKLAADAATGTVIFWGDKQKLLLQPPFPIKVVKFLANGYDVEPIRELLQHDFTIALILVRLGAFAIGVCQGEKLIASKVGTGLVHGRHKKGGSSQHRFERHREKQIEFFIERVCRHTQEKLEPYAKALDYVVYGGARTTILLLEKRCFFLKQFNNRTLPPLLTLPEPKHVVLESAIRQVWSTKITEWVLPTTPTRMEAMS